MNDGDVSNAKQMTDILAGDRRLHEQGRRDNGKAKVLRR